MLADSLSDNIVVVFGALAAVGALFLGCGKSLFRPTVPARGGAPDSRNVLLLFGIPLGAIGGFLVQHYTGNDVLAVIAPAAVWTLMIKSNGAGSNNSKKSTKVI